MRVNLKVTVKLAKVVVIIALVVLCYEAAMQVMFDQTFCSALVEYSSPQGSEANWENVSASTKEDLIALGNILIVKGKEVVADIMKKYNL